MGAHVQTTLSASISSLATPHSFQPSLTWRVSQDSTSKRDADDLLDETKNRVKSIQKIVAAATAADELVKMKRHRFSARLSIPGI
jgi:hypothetical protein